MRDVAEAVPSDAAMPLLVPGVDFERVAFIIRGVLPREECTRLVALAEQQGFESDEHYFVPQDGLTTQLCCRALVESQRISEDLYARVHRHLPRRLGAQTVCGLSENLRFLRYDAGQAFAPHVDGPTVKADIGIASQLSFILYMTGAGEDYGGGLTRFVDEAAPKHGVDVVAKAGDVLIFSHSLMHEGTAVTHGRKYVLRTDVMYCPS